MNKDSKFLPTLVNKIKYTRKVRVSDIKAYLLDEYKLTRELNNENKELREQIEQSEIINQEYDATLITLEEYKTRLEEKNKEIKDLENKINKLKSEIKLLTNERNDLKLKTKDFNLEIEKIKKDGVKEYKKNINNKISNLAGHISKEKVLDIISKF